MINPEYLLERKRLSSSIGKLKFMLILLTIIILILLAKIIGEKTQNPLIKKHDQFIALISISGIINEDSNVIPLLKKVAKNDKIKGMILNINSPGGTAVGGEKIYNYVKKIKDLNKPIVSVLGTLATSAAYMVALPSNSIISHHTSITGSIGAILQTIEVTNLAKKIGIEPHIFTTGQYKSMLNPMEQLNHGTEEIINSILREGYNYFTHIIAENRKIPLELVKKIADGRIYSSSQALELKLIDKIGSMEDAENFIRHSTTPNIEIIELKPRFSAPIINSIIGEITNIFINMKSSFFYNILGY